MEPRRARRTRRFGMKQLNRLPEQSRQIECLWSLPPLSSPCSPWLSRLILFHRPRVVVQAELDDVEQAVDVGMFAGIVARVGGVFGVEF